MVRGDAQAHSGLLVHPSEMTKPVSGTIAKRDKAGLSR